MKPRFGSRSSIGVILGIVVFLVSSIMLAAASVGKPVPSNPDAGLSDAQREQRYAAGRDSFAARYESWLGSLDLSAINYGALERRPIQALYDRPEATTLSDAKAHAELIVLGNVRSIRPTAFDGTYVTLDVAEVLKGKAAHSIVLHQGGGIRPTPNWKGMFIADAMDAPLMIPGDRAVVFLHTGRAGSLEVQGFTGLYRSKSGKLSAVPGNPFAGDINNSLETDFIVKVKAQVP